MKQVMQKGGKIVVEEIPAPAVNDQEVLVQVYFSCISTGTEMASLAKPQQSLLSKAIKKPEKVKDILRTLGEIGFKEVITLVRAGSNRSTTMGYSLSGIVLQIGKKVKNIKPGDRVACAGAGFANHAEFVAVPMNLVTKIPDSVNLDQASTVTLGSIALQGIRRAEPKLGEYVVVLGLGILGQLSALMLKANGCRVIGIDIDRTRLEKAHGLGITRVVMPDDGLFIEKVMGLCGGKGADAVIVTAGASSHEVVNNAAKMCRKKGKIILVGSVKLNFDRSELFKKELDVLMSTSYGPGRYDDLYELEGQDYPYSYVRWTENRNMQAYLGLLEEKRIDIGPLVDRVYDLEDAPKAYNEIQEAEVKPLIVLLKYSSEATLQRTLDNPTVKIHGTTDRLRVAIIGAGGFARDVHMVNLRFLSKIFDLHSIANRRGDDFSYLASRFSPLRISTDYNEIIQDPDVDMVIIATRHDTHAEIAQAAAEAGKAVFLEKPMAITREDLERLDNIIRKTGVPFMVGYNRRFSPYAIKIKEFLDVKQEPFILNYRVNAGYLPDNHWIHGTQGGGRNIGEACHFYDLFNYFTDSDVEYVSAYTIKSGSSKQIDRDNFNVSLRYKNGCLCNLIYTSMGAKGYPKERMEIHSGGRTILLDDYKELRVLDSPGLILSGREANKGHKEELESFAKAIRSGNGFPIPLTQLTQACALSFLVEDMLNT
jgi:predicted dehydrogenase/threonine dehydrogenase-like Zn-dependent dehydrogenase